MEQLRVEKPTYPTSLPSGVTDVRLYNLQTTGSSPVAVQVDGSMKVTPGLEDFAKEFGRTDCKNIPLCKGDFDDDGDVDGSDLTSMHQFCYVLMYENNSYLR